jgi:hypothetical protein
MADETLAEPRALLQDRQTRALRLSVIRTLRRLSMIIGKIRPMIELSGGEGYCAIDAGVAAGRSQTLRPRLTFIRDLLQSSTSIGSGWQRRHHWGRERQSRPVAQARFSGPSGRASRTQQQLPKMRP